MIVMKKAMSNFVIAVFFLVFGIAAQAQEAEKKAEKQGDFEKTATELTESLSAKVQLNPEQVSSIQKILIDYQKSVSGLSKSEKMDKSAATAEIDDKTNNEIVAVLDDNQKTVYETFKSEFWQQIRSRVHAVPMQKEEMKENY